MQLLPLTRVSNTSGRLGTPGNLLNYFSSWKSWKFTKSTGNMPASIRLFVANVPDGSCMSEDFSTFLCTTKSPVENVLQ